MVRSKQLLDVMEITVGSFLFVDRFVGFAFPTFINAIFHLDV